MSTTINSKVAVIGLGNIGKAVAGNLVKGKNHVIIADRQFSKATALATELGQLAEPMDIAAALKQADIVVLAIWFNSISEFLTMYASALEGKIIVDPSNPIAPEEKGGFRKTIGEKESAGEINARYLPKNAKLAKALGTLGVASLIDAAYRKPEAAVLFYATSDTSIDAAVEDLIRKNGFEPVGIGGLDQSIRLEVFGDLHEFGALGKTVTLAEAPLPPSR